MTRPRPVEVAGDGAAVSGTGAPTLVPLAEFSSMLREVASITGASLTSFRFTVTVAAAVSPGAPLSVTCTVRPNDGVLSKSSAVLLATLNWPLLSIANAPPVLPPTIA